MIKKEFAESAEERLLTAIFGKRINYKEEENALNLFAKSIIRQEKLTLLKAHESVQKKELKLKLQQEAKVQNIQGREKKIKEKLEHLLKEEITNKYGNTGCHNCKKEWPGCKESRSYKYDAVMLCERYELFETTYTVDALIDKVSSFGVDRLKLKNLSRAAQQSFYTDHIVRAKMGRQYIRRGLTQ